MAHSLKLIALAATAFAAMAAPLGAAQAQTGYSYLFWPYFTAAPAPSHVRVPSQPQAAAPVVTPVAAPRRAPQDYIRDTSEVRYAPAEIGRSYGAPQTVILGVGY